MPKPHSANLRGRALAAFDEGARPTAVAARFPAAQASVYLWLRQRREEGRSAAKRLSGGPRPVIRDGVEATLRRLVGPKNDLTLAEYRDRLAAEHEARLHPWTVGQALRRLRRTRGLKILRTAERDRPEVAAARRD